MEALYIVWRKEKETGIPIIDEQHRAIVSTINSLFYFMQEKREMEALTPTINMLAQYTRIHFTTEESLLKRAGYTDFDEHLLLHKALVNETAEVIRHATEEKNAGILLSFLREWWMNHINIEDKKYVECLKQYLKIDDSEK